MTWRGEMDALARAAATLGPRARHGKRRRRLFPTLWFVTDPMRIPDPVAVAERLPKGSGVIYRAFGAPDAVRTGHALAATARRRGLVLLVGTDATLAATVGAHGVHLPQRLMNRAPRLRAQRPGWILTAAAHDPRALARAGRLGLDAALVSAVFASRSASAGQPIGPVRFARLARVGTTPVIALGGVNAHTALRLLSSGADGLAAVEAFARLG